MPGTNHIPFPLPGFSIDQLIETDKTVIIQAHSTTLESRCPGCQEASRRVHSLYRRIPADLPSCGKAIRLKLQVKRFRCQNEGCQRQTFVERFPDFLTLHAQRTQRLTDELRAVALEVGGEAGSRVTSVLGMTQSADTLLRIMRRTVLPEPAPPRIVGVDDWAIRKGRAYGTILVDLERRCVLDLLADREAPTLADWLKARPTIEIVSRDRAGAYSVGIQQGAPQALEVADRWHLLKNLWDALAASYTCHQRLLKHIGIEPDALQTASGAVGEDPSADRQPAVKGDQERQAQRAHWEAKFQQVHALRQQGWGIRATARQLQLARNTVRQYSRLPELPHKTSPKSGPRLLDPYRAYLRARLVAANPSSRRLWREIREQGFRGGHTVVYQYVAQVRRDLNLPGLRGTRPHSISQPRRQTLTARQLASLVLCQPEALSTAQERLISTATQLHPDIQQATSLAREFAAMLRQRDGSDFDRWSQAALATDLASLKSFVTGLHHDEAAVRAAFSLPWSNGQVEGQVNRLKFIKRQMYGRALFDLLRLRVLFHP